jgi:hypothetical protein
MFYLVCVMERALLRAPAFAALEVISRGTGIGAVAVAAMYVPARRAGAANPSELLTP